MVIVANSADIKANENGKRSKSKRRNRINGLTNGTEFKAAHDEHRPSELTSDISETSGNELPELSSNETAKGANLKTRVDENQLIHSSIVEENQTNPFSVKIEFNLVAWFLFAVSLLLRTWRINYPNSIVFDELHYGRFVSLYMKRVFFFDSQPPLGKQLVALAAHFVGYDGDSQFTGIGHEYGPNIPVRALRFVPALCGSFIIPIVYHIIVEMGLSHKTACLAAIFVILENSLLTQSRFILMESIMIMFSLFGLFALLKARRKYPMSLLWLTWMTLSSLAFTFGLCVKYSGIFSLFLGIGIAFYDLWKLLPDRTIKTIKLWIIFFTYGGIFIILPIVTYLSVFYVHLGILTKAGPHDSIMTSAFQASLEGGLASITKGQPLEIAHGSQITLRHTHGRACWLHSHAHMYPIRYPDARGSSHQQQVTCYSFKDVNNWWIVKRPDRNDLIVSEPIDKIKDGDIVQLVHGITARTLNSHDVASAMSPQHQEVTCYIDYNISMAAQNLWKVDLINKEETNGYWHTINSLVRFIHINSSQSLKFSGKQLPDWGFNQHEVVTDKLVKQDDTVWNVEEHRYTKSSDEKERERDLVQSEFVPLTPTKLSFLEKFVELQLKMLTVNQENVQDHVYSSESPIDWLLLNKGIAYWISSQSNAQIHLLGNIFLWYCSLFAVFVYLSLLAYYLLRRRRKFYDISEANWMKFSRIGQILLVGYLINFVPYILIDRTLFLHHYLMALVFQIMLLAAIIDHIYIYLKKFIYLTILCILLLISYTFVMFLPLSYGITNLSADDLTKLKWKQSWDFIIHKT